MGVIYTQFYKRSGRVRGRVVAKASDRLWLDMCQLMIWQEQIKRCVCLWENRSSKLEAVTDSLFLWQTVCICDRLSVSVTDSLWQTACDRQSVTDSLWQTVCDRQSVTDTVCVYHRLCVSVIYSLFLLQTVCVFHRQTMSVTVSLCLSQTDCVCHRQSVSVTHSLCLSHTVVVCHRQSLSVTGILCLTHTLFLIILGLVFAYL